jgi:hypothetical protein
MPSLTTIIIPIKESRADSCRQFLRDNVDPASTSSGMQCSRKFPFSLIPTLHFCSFIVLDGDGFGPSLVFEATFDGSREDFLTDLLRVAADGMHELYSHCIGYPASGIAIPHIAIDYLVRHDVGANTFFCGTPGRTVVQIKDEQALRATIVQHLPRLKIGNAFPPRLTPLFEALRSFLRSKTAGRWAEQPAPVPWEVRFRTAVVVAAAIAVLLAACGLGAAVAASFGWRPTSVYGLIVAFLEKARHLGAEITASLTRQLPWTGRLAGVLQPAIPLIGLSAIWLALRILELFFSISTRHPRDQSFLWRSPLHISVILRYGALLFLAGAVALALVRELGTPDSRPDASVPLSSVTLLIGIAVALLFLQNWATSLRLAAQFYKLKRWREIWRRLALDIVMFLMAVFIAIGILVIADYLPISFNESLAGIITSLVYLFLAAVAYGLTGILAAYIVGLILFLVVHRIELRDSQKFNHPAMLLATARSNEKKYAREEGGKNQLQNHLASITRVKPGFVRIALLRATLFVINLLSRFWFNRGELGDIPTILSARWVLIDGGRRLLFLDNYGGAWESYLNEFIDMMAVKGLNAIWTNTFVKIGNKDYSFPETKFYFWSGAQAERPFKAYVRQSQVETIAWYSAYPTMSVVNINTNSWLRQSLSKPLSAPKIDAVFENL